MNLREQLEYPIPVINRDEDKIYIETSGSCEGSIAIKNDGGGEIRGRIMSNSRALTFHPGYFRGNDAKVMYTLNLEMFKPGDVLRTDAVILSNGGEHTIEFVVKMIPYAIEAREGERIASLDDFLGYSLKYPVSARQLFVSHEFMMWLYTTGYPYMDMYERLVKDKNKERALDNFFLMNGLKEKNQIQAATNDILLRFRPADREIHKGALALQLAGTGYAEEEIKIKDASPWLRIEKEKISSSDFAPKSTFSLPYFVNPLQLTQRVSSDKILLGNQVIQIMCIKQQFIEAVVERAHLGSEDKTHVIIHNHTGGKLSVDIFPTENYLVFQGYRFIVGSYAKIPFEVKLSSFQKTQFTLKKQPVNNCGLRIESVYNGINFNKFIPLKVGGFL